ncbi:proteasome subunit alpha type-7-1, partial [Plutella xylostella]|uniref:proteasome subunit alpha type-7-1 n=1 Tax=Plutella xylostella TaxID=51655 RepID=UPI00203286CC
NLLKLAMSRYDRAVTVFSPDGQLLQVQYAQEAVRMGSTCAGVRGRDCVVLAVVKRSVPRLQDPRIERKVVVLDDHVAMAFAGLRADARVLANRAQIECQSYRLTAEDAVTVEYITKYIANLKQQYTQCNGRRPFGVSCLIGGFDPDGGPHLFQTEPSGIFYEWKAAAVGRREGGVQEFLEASYSADLVATDQGAVRLALRGLVQVLETGQKNLDVVIIKKDQPIKYLDRKTIHAYIKQLQKEKQTADVKKKK